MSCISNCFSKNIRAASEECMHLEQQQAAQLVAELMTDEQLGNCKFQTANFCAVSFVNACRMLADLPDKNGWVTEDKVCWPTFMTSNERLSSQ